MMRLTARAIAGYQWPPTTGFWRWPSVARALTPAYVKSRVAVANFIASGCSSRKRRWARWRSLAQTIITPQFTESGSRLVQLNKRRKRATANNRDGRNGNGDGDDSDSGDSGDDDADLDGSDGAVSAAYSVWRKLRAEYKLHTADAAAVAAMNPEASGMVDEEHEGDDDDDDDDDRVVYRIPSFYHTKFAQAASKVVLPLVERWAGIKVESAAVYGTRV
jgi:hypothetical protein